MDSIHHLHITNHWAILVSAVFLWILGAAWYSPALFAKPWMALLNIKPEPGKNKGLLAGMIASFIGDLVLSFVLWHMVSWAGAVTWSAGVFVGLLVWVGFFVAPNFPQGIYEQRPFKLFAINNGYWLVGLVVTSALLAVWR
jgi:hypothetical protein